MIAALLLAVASLDQVPAPKPAPETRPLSLWTTVTLSSGEKRRVSGVTFPDWATESKTWYFLAKPTACNTLSTARKAEPGEKGWMISIRPGTPGAGPRIISKRWHMMGGAARTLPPTMAGSVELDVMPPALPDGKCDAVRWSVEASFEPLAPRDLLEAELWFVHRAPDGKETSQRQVVRMRPGGQGEFYFDDMNIDLLSGTRKVPIAVEVFGSILASRISGNEVNVSLKLTRRYINRTVAFGKWPKTGRTEYPLTVTSDEVVSFVLPPLESDDGILLGHRFSVRLRIKPVGEGEN